MVLLYNRITFYVKNKGAYYEYDPAVIFQRSEPDFSQVSDPGPGQLHPGPQPPLYDSCCSLWAAVCLIDHLKNINLIIYFQAKGLAQKKWRAVVTGDPDKKIRDYMHEIPQVVLSYLWPLFSISLTS